VSCDPIRAELAQHSGADRFHHYRIVESSKQNVARMSQFLSSSERRPRPACNACHPSCHTDVEPQSDPAKEAEITQPVAPGDRGLRRLKPAVTPWRVNPGNMICVWLYSVAA
jgi:hypothetical protein